MSKYTPGPWTVDFDSYLNVFIDAATKPALAECLEGSAEYEGRVGGLLGGGVTAEETMRANAQLISAAPDLLEALRDVLDWYGTGSIAYSMSSRGNASQYHKTLNAAYAAIAKAQAEPKGYSHAGYSDAEELQPDIQNIPHPTEGE